MEAYVIIGLGLSTSLLIILFKLDITKANTLAVPIDIFMTIGSLSIFGTTLGGIVISVVAGLSLGIALVITTYLFGKRPLTWSGWA